MTQEEKELLLKDLSGRLPYGVKLKYIEDCVVKKISHTITMDTVWLEHVIYGDADVKPYLRPMSSMTEEEYQEYGKACDLDCDCSSNTLRENLKAKSRVLISAWHHGVDWLNAHHFDYRGLIEKGLALEAPEGTYKTE